MQAGGHDEQQEEDEEVVPGSGFGGWRKMLGRWGACHGGWLAAKLSRCEAQWESLFFLSGL
jgi:hypothetical protein